MDEEILDRIGRLAERLDKALFAHKTMKTVPERVHLEGLTATMRSVRDALKKIYQENGGTEKLNIQA